MKSRSITLHYSITGAIRGTFKEKLYQELGLEPSVKDDGIENFVTFSKYLKVNLWSIFPLNEIT